MKVKIVTGEYGEIAWFEEDLTKYPHLPVVDVPPELRERWSSLKEQFEAAENDILDLLVKRDRES